MAVLVSDQPLWRPGGTGLAVLAGLLAALAYGVGANLSRRLAALSPLSAAAGSLLGAALVLLLAAAWLAPATPPPVWAWGAAVALGVLPTAFAYVLYFRLLAQVGVTRASAVTFLIPVFGVLWGAVFLGEAVTPTVLAGAAVILAGTALTAVRRGSRPPPGSPSNPRNCRRRPPGLRGRVR